MKKIFTIALTLLLVGCSTQSKVDGRTAEEWKQKHEATEQELLEVVTQTNQLKEKIQTLEDKESDVFEKNHQCYEYESEIKKWISEDTLLEAGPFYSLKTNSCVFAQKFWSISQDSWCAVVDVFTKQTHEEVVMFGMVPLEEACHRLIKEFQ